MKKSLINKILKVTLPLFIEAWKKRSIKHAHRSEEIRGAYREGYWDGVIDTLQIGLNTKSKPEDPILH